MAFMPLLLAVLAASSGQAQTATRNFTVTGFNKIRVEGAYNVEVRTGRGPSAQATGDARALDQLSVQVQGTTLVIKTDHSNWTGWPGEQAGGASLIVTTPVLSSVALNGSGDISISRMAAARVDIAIAGSGDVAVTSIATDRLRLDVMGSGKAALAGEAATGLVTVQGAGGVEAAGLKIADVDVTVAGSGDVALSAKRSAKVKASGSGNVVIGGKIACAVSSVGAGQVSCGGKKAF